MKLILTIATMFLLLGCSDQSKKDVEEVSKKVQNVDMQKVIQKTKEATTEVIESVKKTDVEKVVEQSVAKVEEIAVAAVAKGGDITKNVKDEVIKVLDSVQITSTTASSIDGAALFSSKCASCHGENGEKAALGKSEVISKWTIAKFKIAISGYKDGSYGGNMKVLMKSQVATLSDAEILALAEFVSKK